MAKRTPDVEELSFEQALAELEHLVEQIESGEVGLEQALAQYERGAALIHRCRTVLTAAERKIAELTADASGRLAVQGETHESAPLIAEEDSDDADDAPF